MTVNKLTTTNQLAYHPSYQQNTKFSINIDHNHVHEQKCLQVPNGTVQGGPKNWTCLSVDNSAMVTRRKPLICQKF